MNHEYIFYVYVYVYSIICCPSLEKELSVCKGESLLGRRLVQPHFCGSGVC